jgi:hypothetical protein
MEAPPVALTRTRRRRLLAGIAAFLVAALVLGLAAGAAGAAGSERAAAGALLGTVAGTVHEATGHEVLVGGASSPSSQASTSTVPAQPANARGAIPAAGEPPRSQATASSGSGSGSSDASRSTGSSPSSSLPKIAVVGSVTGTLVKATGPVRAETRKAVTTVTRVAGAAVPSTPAIQDLAYQVETVSGIGRGTLATARQAVRGVVAGATGGGQLEPVPGTHPGAPQTSGESPGLPTAGPAGELRAGEEHAPGAVELAASGLLEATAVTALPADLAPALAPGETSLQMTGAAARAVGAASVVGASGDRSAAPAPAGPGAYAPGSASGAEAATPVSLSSAPTVPPEVPGGGGAPASSVGAAAACAGLALALLWLLGVAFAGATRRLRGRSEIWLSAPFELILERPG